MRLPESLKAGLRAFTTSRYTPPKEVIKNIFSPPTLPSSFPHLCTTHPLAPTQVRDLNPASGRQDHTSSVSKTLQGAFLLPLRHPLHHRGHLAGQVCLDTGDLHLIISQEQLRRSNGLTDLLTLVFKILKRRISAKPNILLPARGADATACAWLQLPLCRILLPPHC